MSGLRFVVVGAGRSGLALARFLLERKAEVILTDQRSEGLSPEVAELGRRGARLRLGGHDEADFTAAEAVLVSPGVPLSLPIFATARRAGVKVWGEIEFASRFLTGSVIGITGTNGKSTTTTLVGGILAAAGLDAPAGGNLGTPLMEMASGDHPGRRYVVELSSFQLEGIEKFRPAVAVLLNVAPDHQDRYPDHEAYRAAKGRIFENQHPEDRALLNRDDPASYSFAPTLRAEVSLFSRETTVEDGAAVEEEWVVARRDGRSHRVIRRDALPLVGVHNLENVLAAVATAQACGVDPAQMVEPLRRFQGLPHRIELVGEVDSVPYYNDSKATNVAATARSLESFPAGVVLILGGKDKGGDFASLVPLLRERAAAVILMGKSRAAIRAQIGEPVPLVDAATMADAVAAARATARPGQVVLLAPGCASFDAYANFEERGADFRTRVRALPGATAKGAF